MDRPYSVTRGALDANSVPSLGVHQLTASFHQGPCLSQYCSFGQMMVTETAQELHDPSSQEACAAPGSRCHHTNTSLPSASFDLLFSFCVWTYVTGK